MAKFKGKAIPRARIEKILQAVPVRVPILWYVEDDMVTLVYQKRFTRFERIIYRVIGGPSFIRRPMDAMSSRVWLMCNGEHDVKEICDVLYAEFKEDVEPVFQRVVRLMEILAERNLVRFRKDKGPVKGIGPRSKRYVENVQKVQDRKGKGRKAKKKGTKGS